MPANCKPLKGQYFLFTNTGEQKPWTARTDLPSLDGVSELSFDTEATGKNKRKDTPIGLSTNVTGYLPWGHAGGNLDPERVREWCKIELRNKKLIGLNIGYDAELMLRWGVDLEAQGCQLYDIAHGAALLNENRYAGFNLGDLGLEYCGRPKLDEALEKDRMPDYHASMVGAYAEEDANLTWDVYQAQRPLIAKDKLEKVDDLESKLIWANNHMERSGARLDVDKMHRFANNLRKEVGNLCMEVWKKTGVRVEPNQNATWDRLFIACDRDPNHVKINAKGKDVSSYTDEYLKGLCKELGDGHPIADALRSRRLLSLDSKYFKKYDAARVQDQLYFNLYQLRSGEEEQGTVVGRYSSANVNIQQVFKVENQVKRFGDGYIIRELMIPDDGFDMFAMDGSQLQFRLFAHLSQDRDLIRAYHDGYKRWLAGDHCIRCHTEGRNPTPEHLRKPGEIGCPNHCDVDFHQMVADLFSMSRQNAKTNNFALVMGMGRAHLAHNLGKGCNCQPENYWWWKGDRDTFKKFEVNDNHAEDCPAREANDLAYQYEKQFPSAPKTMEYVVKFAKAQNFVPTLLGRRRRYAEYEQRNGFRQKTRYYKALASWLQGSEADVVKTKILTVYNHRKEIGIHKMRMPVHDEMTGDIDKDPAARKRLQEISRIQEIPCRVPIVWVDEYGDNWRACSGK